MELVGTEEVVGNIQIADEVVVKIAAAAALEADGVYGTRGVKVDSKDGVAGLEMSVLIKFGSKIRALSEDVQRRVKTAIETMTGLTVSKVDLVVAGVVEQPRK